MAKTFVLECYWPGVTVEDHDAAVGHAEAAARALDAEGCIVKFLGATLVAADEIAFFRFAAATSGDVERIGRHARIPYDRVVEYVDRGPSVAT